LSPPPARARTPDIQPLPATAAHRFEEFCPVCARPDDFCEICGGPHDQHRPHTRVAAEPVLFTRADVLAVEREAEAWEKSQEYERDVHGVRDHTARLRALAAKLELLILMEGGEGLPARQRGESKGA
jgi:hypothetical protein